MAITEKPKVACPLFSRTGTEDGTSDKHAEREYIVNGYIRLYGTGRIMTGKHSSTGGRGAELKIDATYDTPGEGWELRWAIVDWADVDSITQFQGIYLRVENQEANQSATLRGAEITARDNNVGIGALHGLHVNAYVKGASDSITIKQVDGIQAQVEFCSNVGTRTISSTSSALHAIVYTGGTITNVATYLNGITVTVGDQDGQSTTIANGLLFEDSSGTSGTCALTTGINITLDCTTAIAITADCGNGIVFNGTYTDDVIDFTDVTINHTGSNGPCLIRAGTYASPVTNADEDQSGMIRLYMETTADGSSYDRGIFVCLKTQGAKGIFPIAGLAEGKDGCTATKIQAAQFIAHLNHAGATLSALGGDATAGMYGAWLKITANEGATTESGSRAAPLWVDNQLYGANISATMEEYGIFATTGGSKPKAFIGFETTSSGYTNLLYFDETAYDQDPISDLVCNTDGEDSDKSIKIDLNGTTYYIPIFDSAT